MTYTKKAMKLCFEAHKDQVDKSGMPYVFHPFHLAEQMPDYIKTLRKAQGNFLTKFLYPKTQVTMNRALLKLGHIWKL